MTRSRKPRRLKEGFFERTLQEVGHALESSLFAEDMAARPGLLQRLDPRVKVLTFLALIVAVSLARSFPPLILLHLLALALAVSARIPVGFYLKRVWIFIPLFTSVIAFPALFNLFTPGRTLLILLDWGQPLSWGFFSLPSQLAITEQGLRTATFLMLRVTTSVSFVLLLLLTTRWTSLLKALRVLYVPRTFVAILGMTHRYFFLVLQTMKAMFLARGSRRVGRLPAAEERRWLTGVMGNLLDKSYHLSNEVYSAMLSRGFRGEVVTLDTFALGRGDWAWMSLVALILAGIFLWP